MIENFKEEMTMTHMWHLMKEIEHLKTKIQPHDTGHIHTTIRVLEGRVHHILQQDNSSNICGND